MLHPIKIGVVMQLDSVKEIEFWKENYEKKIHYVRQWNKNNLY